PSCELAFAAQDRRAVAVDAEADARTVACDRERRVFVRLQRRQELDDTDARESRAVLFERSRDAVEQHDAGHAGIAGEVTGQRRMRRRNAQRLGDFAHGGHARGSCESCMTLCASAGQRRTSRLMNTGSDTCGMWRRYQRRNAYSTTSNASTVA